LGNGKKNNYGTRPKKGCSEIAEGKKKKKELAQDRKRATREKTLIPGGEPGKIWER